MKFEKLRKSKGVDYWREGVCEKDNILKHQCKKYMRGFLQCPNKDWEDGNGTVPPLLGYDIFPWENHDRAFNAIHPQFVRLAVTANDNIDQCVNRIQWYRAKGVLVILCLQDKHRPENTVNIGYEYARRLEEGITYECWNEQNSNIAPDSEGWNNFISPDQYFNIYVNFRNRILSVRPNAKIMFGGLNGEGRKTKEGKHLSAENYLQQLHNKGISSITDYYNWHCYSDEAFYVILEKCKDLDKNKPMIIGEFGTENPNEDRKIEKHGHYMDKFTLNKIFGAIVYAWKGGENWEMESRSKYTEFINNYKRR